MKIHRIVLLTIILATLVASAHAQELQISPYIGGAVSSKVANAASFKGSPLYGLRWSMYTIPQLSIEANLARQNDFKFKDTTATDSHALIFDLNGLYHFTREGDDGEPRKFSPFATAGIGFLTADVKNGVQPYAVSGDKATAGLPPSNSGARLVNVIDGRKFFTINYGGGLQGSRLAGPFGVRFDARGRTAPNMLGSVTHFFEVSGGVTFNFVFPY